LRLLAIDGSIELFCGTLAISRSGSLVAHEQQEGWPCTTGHEILKSELYVPSAGWRRGRAGGFASRRKMFVMTSSGQHIAEQREAEDVLALPATPARRAGAIPVRLRPSRIPKRIVYARPV
jgi:hypothetical protein